MNVLNQNLVICSGWNKMHRKRLVTSRIKSQTPIGLKGWIRIWCKHTTLIFRHVSLCSYLISTIFTLNEGYSLDEDKLKLKQKIIQSMVDLNLLFQMTLVLIKVLRWQKKGEILNTIFTSRWWPKVYYVELGSWNQIFKSLHAKGLVWVTFLVSTQSRNILWSILVQHWNVGMKE